jgi:hypothetical protein
MRDPWVQDYRNIITHFYAINSLKVKEETLFLSWHQNYPLLFVSLFFYLSSTTVSSSTLTSHTEWQQKLLDTKLHSLLFEYLASLQWHNRLTWHKQHEKSHHRKKKDRKTLLWLFKRNNISRKESKDTRKPLMQSSFLPVLLSTSFTEERDLSSWHL